MSANTLPQLSRFSFRFDNSGLHTGTPHNDLFDDDHHLRPGWTALGWCPNSELNYRRPDEDIAGTDSIWVAIMYHDDGGREVWFHHIREAADFGLPPVPAALVDPEDDAWSGP